MTALSAPRYWYRCRTCRHSRASDWTALPLDLTGTRCGSCGSQEITLYEIATRARLVLSHSCVPPMRRWACCTCGGGGIDSHGHTCPDCHGHGNHY